jgi:hypothetical protein
VLALRRIWLYRVVAVQDGVQEQVMDAGLGILVKTSFDSLAKSIYTSSDEGRSVLASAMAVIEEDTL